MRPLIRHPYELQEKVAAFHLVAIIAIRRRLALKRNLSASLPQSKIDIQ